jgi:hypothetical protein
MGSQKKRRKAGIALEEQAIRVLRAAGLSRRKTRKRESDEVDMLFGNADLLMRTWHVRFKDCEELTLDDAATEVGVAQGYGNRVALVAGTGRVSAAASRYAAHVTSKTCFQVILLDGRKLRQVERDPRRLRETIAIQAPLALVAVPAKRRHPDFQ